MGDDLHILGELWIPEGELHFTASRSGGPGGQYVNTTSSRVTLCWNVRESAVLSEIRRERILDKLRNRINAEGVLQVHVDTERSRHRNLALAKERLALLIRGALAVQKKRVPTRVTKGANRRRLDQKQRLGRLKQQRRRPRDDE